MSIHWRNCHPAPLLADNQKSTINSASSNSFGAVKFGLQAGGNLPGLQMPQILCASAVFFSGGEIKLTFKCHKFTPVKSNMSTTFLRDSFNRALGLAPSPVRLIFLLPARAVAWNEDHLSSNSISYWTHLKSYEMCVCTKRKANFSAGWEIAYKINGRPHRWHKDAKSAPLARVQRFELERNVRVTQRC